MTGQGPLNYTTTIAASKSAGECMDLLQRYGVSMAALVFRKDKTPCGLAFRLETQWGERAYEVMVDADKTYKVLDKYRREGKITQKWVSKEHADRVAWRVIKMWLEAQLSLIEAGLMDAETALAGSMLVGPGETLLGSYSRAQRELEAGR
jgi:hypothetical protein